MVRRSSAFRLGSWVALTGCLLSALSALAVLVLGALGLTGVTDQPRHIELVPGLVSLDISAQWPAQSRAPVCPEVHLADLRNDGCYNLALHREPDTSARGQTRRSTTTDVRPEEVRLDGVMTFRAGPGWHPLLAALYAAGAAGLAVVAFVLFWLWRLLRGAASGEPFTATAVRSLRMIGGAVVLWQLAQTAYWLLFSPKALDYSLESFGPGPMVTFGPMQPSPSLTVIGFGLLLLLLAEAFAYGAEIEVEQKLTV